MRTALLISALVLMAGACTTPTEIVADGTLPSTSLQFGEPFTLRLGETVQIASDDAALRFDTVISDSPCPTDVDCIREGEAIAQFTLHHGGEVVEPFQLEIAGFVTEIQEFERYEAEAVGPYAFALLLLQPYPGLTAEEGMPVTATLEVRRTP